MNQKPTNLAEWKVPANANLSVEKDFKAMSGFTDEAKIKHLFDTALRLEGDLNASIQQVRRYCKYNSRLLEDFEQLKTQLRLSEEHAITMARDFDASLTVVREERDRLAHDPNREKP